MQNSIQCQNSRSQGLVKRSLQATWKTHVMKLVASHYNVLLTFQKTGSEVGQTQVKMQFRFSFTKKKNSTDQMLWKYSAP